MGNAPVLEKRKFTWFLLFVGFCCVFGWLAMNAILLTNFTNARHFSSLTATLQTILGNLIYSSFYVILGVIAFVWARRRLKRTVNKERLVSKSVLPAVFLTPVLGFVGIIVSIMGMYAYAHARQIVVGPNVVQSADSPDGTYQAFVWDKPSIDGPNHHLYVKTPATGRLDYVDNLPEDVDSNQEIIWSPHNDVVVFRTNLKLLAYAPSIDKRKEIDLGVERYSHGNGTFGISYSNVKKVTDIDFSVPRQVSVQLEGEDAPHILTFEDKPQATTCKRACGLPK